MFAPIDGFTNIADIRGPDAYFDLSRTFEAGPSRTSILFWNADRWLDRGNVHAIDAFLNIRFAKRSKLALDVEWPSRLAAHLRRRLLLRLARTRIAISRCAVQDVGAASAR